MSFKYDPPYQHQEAYRLMHYHCGGCGHINQAWNSRDGVTPFAMGCTRADCHGLSTHVMGRDEPRTKRLPTEATLVFVSVTQEDARQLAAARVREVTKSGWKVDPETEAGLAETYFGDGNQPMAVTVEDYLKRTTAKLDTYPNCDTCGKPMDYMPWHYSKGEERHLHACDDCWPKVNPNAGVGPAVASEEMLTEGVEALIRGLKAFPGNYIQVVSNIWEDMRAASPTAPSEQDARGPESECRFCAHREWVEAEGATLHCPFHGDGTHPQPDQGDGELCQSCGRTYYAIYWAPDHVWEHIKPSPEGEGGLLCIECAHSRAKVAGFVLRFSGSDKRWGEGELMDSIQLLHLLARIRSAVGDPEGELMQDELVEHIAELRRRVPKEVEPQDCPRCGSDCTHCDSSREAQVSEINCGDCGFSLQAEVDEDTITEMWNLIRTESCADHEEYADARAELEQLDRPNPPAQEPDQC